MILSMRFWGELTSFSNVKSTVHLYVIVHNRGILQKIKNWVKNLKKLIKKLKFL